jgi:1-deoxy-D-xylulose-5-phosphate reductoisomerase
MTSDGHGLNVPGARRVVVLGSTGSIGTQALDVVRANPDRFRVVGLAAGRDAPALADQARELGVRDLAMSDEEAALRLKELVPEATIRGGQGGVAELAALPDADVVLNGVVGALGLAPTLAALEAGHTLALANKESLIAGGSLVLAAAGGRPDALVPVDSEHSALVQCLRGERRSEVARVVLTASGGPFRGRHRDDLAAVTPREALGHPTWDMGPVITVNSATLMNKGLELIEAQLLFGLDWDMLDVVVHPQSVVHSMVEFVDGSTIAQMSPPDMRLPIQLALSWPERLPTAFSALDWTEARELTFEPVDRATFAASSGRPTRSMTIHESRGSPPALPKKTTSKFRSRSSRVASRASPETPAPLRTSTRSRSPSTRVCAEVAAGVGGSCRSPAIREPMSPMSTRTAATSAMKRIVRSRITGALR